MPYAVTDACHDVGGLTAHKDQRRQQHRHTGQEERPQQHRDFIARIEQREGAHHCEDRPRSTDVDAALALPQRQQPADERGEQSAREENYEQPPRADTLLEGCAEQQQHQHVHQQVQRPCVQEHCGYERRPFRAGLRQVAGAEPQLEPGGHRGSRQPPRAEEREVSQHQRLRRVHSSTQPTEQHRRCQQ